MKHLKELFISLSAFVPYISFLIFLLLIVLVLLLLLIVLVLLLLLIVLVLLLLLLIVLVLLLLLLPVPSHLLLAADCLVVSSSSFCCSCFLFLLIFCLVPFCSHLILHPPFIHATASITSNFLFPCLHLGVMLNLQQPTIC